jgi:hypothetical protein
MNIAVEGRKYQGKSTLAFYLAERIQRRTHSYTPVFFDPKWTFRSVAHTEDVDEFADMLPDAKDGLAFRPASQFSDDDIEKVREDFTAFCEAINLESLLRHPPDRPIIIVIDEAYYLQSGKYVHPWLARLIRLATEHKIFVILAVHRPTQIAPDVRSQIDQFFFFRQILPDDLDAVREVADEESAEIVANLPKHHVLEYNVESRTREVWSRPELWYRNISKDINEGEHDDRDESGITRPGNRITVASGATES